MSPSAATAVGTSSSLKPAHFVAQYTVLCSFDMATMFPASTSRFDPSSPCPYCTRWAGSVPAIVASEMPQANGARSVGVLRILLWEAVGADVERAAGRSVAGEVVRNAVDALDEPGQALGLGVVVDRGDLELGGGVAEADHRLVAHLQDRRRRVLGAGGRERPRELEIVTRRRRRLRSASIVASIASRRDSIASMSVVRSVAVRGEHG